MLHKSKMEQMQLPLNNKKKWLIKSVYIFKLYPGFSLRTQGGFISFTPRTATWTLRRSFPHLKDKILRRKPQTKKEIEDCFVGQYAYGEFKDYIHFDGSISKIFV